MDAAKLASLAAHFAWFYLGVHGRSLWDRTMASAAYWKLALAGCCYLIVCVPMMVFDLDVQLRVLLSCLALYAMAQLVGLVRMDSFLPRMLQRLGSQTLPVYIFHIFLISLISALVKISGLLPVLQGHLFVSNALLPPLVTLPIVMATVWLGAKLRSGPFRWLLEAPAALVGAKSPVLPQPMAPVPVATER
jgi:fucose 4-O-acetylase-like acetyltransferase